MESNNKSTIKLYQSVTKKNKNNSSVSSSLLPPSSSSSSRSSLITLPINYQSNNQQQESTRLITTNKTRLIVGRERILIQERDEDLEKIRFLLSNLDVDKYRRRSTSRSSSVTLRSRPPSAEGRAILRRPEYRHEEFQQEISRQQEFQQPNNRQSESRESESEELESRHHSHYNSSPFVRTSSVRGLPARSSFIRNTDFRHSERRPQSCLFNRNYSRISSTPTRDPLIDLKNSKHVLINEESLISKDSQSRNSLHLSPLRKPPLPSTVRDSSVTRKVFVPSQSLSVSSSPSSTLQRASRPKSRISSAFGSLLSEDSNSEDTSEDKVSTNLIDTSDKNLSKLDGLKVSKVSKFSKDFERSKSVRLSPFTRRKVILTDSPKSAPINNFIIQPNFNLSTIEKSTNNFSNSVPPLSPLVIRKNADNNLHMRTFLRTQSSTTKIPTVNSPIVQTSTPKLSPIMASSPVPRMNSKNKILDTTSTQNVRSHQSEYHGSSSSSSLQEFDHRQDTRTHVVGELYDTEKSYVESLDILVNRYIKPLKAENVIESNLVDEIFYQIPEILKIHESFLELLTSRLANWDSKQVIGDVFIEAFTKEPISEIYTLFINNWKNARETMKLHTSSKSVFAKFLESATREHKGKLTLDALLIMPVQRIPRYELLIKELIKHTANEHPDQELLQSSQILVHELALKINRIEKESFFLEQQAAKMKEIESLIDGFEISSNLSSEAKLSLDRNFIRYDFVSIPGGLGIKKDRCLFLFSDLLLITSIKRKSGTSKKSSSSSLSGFSHGSSSMILEGNKYKLLSRLSLDNIDVCKGNETNLKKTMKDIESLQEDLKTLDTISEQVTTLSCSHQKSNLEDSVKDLLSSLTKQLIEKQTSDSQLLTLELTITSQDGIDSLTIIFPCSEKRAQFEGALIEAKIQLAASIDKLLPPEFMYPIPIRKTRPGLQFTCAATTIGYNSFGYKDVWVCNSDGYVGQVCVLSLQPDPNVTSCNGVCNARISCIASIPASANIPADSPNPAVIRDHEPSSRTSSNITNADEYFASLSSADSEGLCSSSGISSSVLTVSTSSQPGSPPLTPIPHSAGQPPPLIGHQHHLHLIRSPSHSPSKSFPYETTTSNSSRSRTEVRRSESDKYQSTTSGDKNNNDSTTDITGLSPPTAEPIKKHTHKLSSTSTTSTAGTESSHEGSGHHHHHHEPHDTKEVSIVGNTERRVSQFQLDSDSSDSDSPDDDASNTSTEGGTKDVPKDVVVSKVCTEDNRTLTSEGQESDPGGHSDHHDDDVILPSPSFPVAPSSSGIGSVSPSRGSPSSSVSTTGSIGTGTSSSIGHPHHPHFHHHQQQSFEQSFDRSGSSSSSTAVAAPVTPVASSGLLTTATTSIPGDLSSSISGLCLNETANQSTMWLGTEDGCIHVYNCTDNIRIKKNKVKIQLSSTVNCIIYLENKVYAGLSNGQLAVFSRDSDSGCWITNEPMIIELSSTPVLNILPVNGKLWCAVCNHVKVFNTCTKEIELSFHVSLESTRVIHSMVSSGLGVWIATQSCPIIRLYHSITFECLLDVNLAPTVSKILSCCDDIIRQHKTACLRVTSLLTCKDLLWIGTSAGVILTLAIPHLTSTTSKLDTIPNVSGLPKGHTGHVRFLTAVEIMVPESTPSIEQPSEGLKSFKRRHKSKTRKTLAAIGSFPSTGGSGDETTLPLPSVSKNTFAKKLMIVSGGDGFEDFSSTITGTIGQQQQQQQSTGTTGTFSNESAGRDDSTNHLLLWSV